MDVLFRLTPVTEIPLTVTKHVANSPPSFAQTTILAVPTDMAVTTPEDETVATEGL